MADGLTPEWTEPNSFVATLDPQATDQVFEGQTSFSLSSSPTLNANFLTWKPVEPVEGLGYRFRLAFHPGQLEGADDSPKN